MKNLSKENFLLLGVMLLSSMGAFSFFPYVSTALVGYLGLSNVSMASVIAFGMFTGNTLAYIVCLRIAEPVIKPVLWAGYAMALVAVASIAAAKFTPAVVAFGIVAASITLYRFSIGLSANLSRALQMRYLPRREEKLRIFAYIKLGSSIAGALGPLAGSLAIKLWGFSGVLALSATFFTLALVLLACIPRPAALPDATAAVRSPGLWSTLRSQPPMVFLVATTALLHFIFEAQIYSSISLNIQHNASDYVSLIAVLFGANSLLLIVLVVPVLNIVNARKNKFASLAFGSLLSMVAIVYAYYATTWLEVAVVAALFTIGEIIVPQVLMDMATDGEQQANSVGAVATFNFFTSGIGMSLGFWLGGVVPSLHSPIAVAAVWIGIYLAFLGMARYATSCSQQGKWLRPLAA